jgi:hypothetical protein
MAGCLNVRFRPISDMQILAHLGAVAERMKKLVERNPFDRPE